MTCPLCGRRKAKRACPAKGVAICPQCCGALRRVEIACPDDCVYLTGEHAHGWAGRETERRRDLRRIAPYVGTLEEGAGRLFFLMLVAVVQHAQAHGLDDRLVADAVSAVRRTAQSRAAGVLYEQRPEDTRAARLAHDLGALLEDEQLGEATDTQRLAALEALDGAVQDTLKEQGGARAFLDSAARAVADLVPKEPPRPRLIVEP